MYSVYQHWDPLKVCVVGRSYPPEFYSWIKVTHVRKLMEKIATETEEDYQHIIEKLQEFGVEILRPNFPTEKILGERYIPPPMCPRDIMIMAGEDFYTSKPDSEMFLGSNTNISTWNSSQLTATMQDCYGDIVKHVQSQGNQIKISNHPTINGAMISRIGKDLYFGTMPNIDQVRNLEKEINENFLHTRNHIVKTGGHADGVFCPVCPGLIISLCDIPTYEKTFPGWEVVYLQDQSWSKVKPFLDLKQKNRGKWWIPGFEYDNDVIETIETWLGHWTGYVEETVFDVNMLIIDPKNVMVFNYNKQVFDALDRYGITPHIVPFRHRYFWDGGIHCVTLDLHREGVMQDFFPNKS